MQPDNGSNQWICPKCKCIFPKPGSGKCPFCDIELQSKIDEPELVNRLKAEIEFFKEREKAIVNELSVADGGEYRADILSAIEKLKTERDRAFFQLAKAVDALKMVREELRYAPCRDNKEHTLCLKCKAEEIADKVLSEIGAVHDI